MDAALALNLTIPEPVDPAAADDTTIQVAIQVAINPNMWKLIRPPTGPKWVHIHRLGAITPFHSGDERKDLFDFPLTAEAVATADNEQQIYDPNLWKQVVHRYRTEWVPINQQVCLTPLPSDYVVPENAWAVVAQQIASSASIA
jgi:hypothetical protein